MSRLANTLKRHPWLYLAAGAGFLLLLLAGQGRGDPGQTVEARLAEIRTKSALVMGLSTAEVQALIVACDQLHGDVEELPETPRKVNRKRLEMTRKLLLFALEVKQRSPAVAP